MEWMFDLNLACDSGHEPVGDCDRIFGDDRDLDVAASVFAHDDCHLFAVNFGLQNLAGILGLALDHVLAATAVSEVFLPA